MKILLASPPLILGTEADHIGYPNIGILSLIGYARGKCPEHEYFYLESTLYDEYMKKVKELNPDVIGLSFSSTMHEAAYLAINGIKKLFPDIPVICGGAHPTAMVEDVFNSSNTDIAVLGEGEVTFVELLEHYNRAGKPLREINGIAYRGSDGIVKTDKRRFVDINSIPMIAWDIIDFKDYRGAHVNKRTPSTCLLASRGCPFDCTFCSNPIWKSDKPWMRLRDPLKVAEEVKYLYGRGIREIYIRSDELNPNLKWAMEVCSEIEKLGYKDLYFHCNLKADKVTVELAKALARINCWIVHLGIESANDRVLRGIEKFTTVAQITNCCKILRNEGIKVYGFMMLFQAWEENGKLCFETKEEVQNTLKYSLKMISKGHINYISWSITSPFPASKLWNVAVKHDLISEDTKGSWTWDVSMRLPGISQKEVQRYRKLGFILQVWCVLRNGGINIKMWRHFLRKAKYIIKGSA